MHRPGMSATDAPAEVVATRNVLLIEDNPGDARLVAEQLHEIDRARYALTNTRCLADGLRAVSQTAFDVILLDRSLPDSVGLDGLSRLHAAAPDVPIVMLTGLDDEAAAVESLRNGAEDYLIKGEVTAAMLSRALRYAIERKRADRALRASEERFRTLARHAPVGIFMTDRAGACSYVNEAWCRMTERTPEDAHQHGWLATVHPGDKNSVVGQWQAALTSGHEFALEFRYQRPHGHSLWVYGTATPLHNDDGGLGGYIGTVVDVTARKQSEFALQQLSISDELTGLHNRRGFLSLAEQNLKLAQRTGRPLALFFIDLNGMKQINDRLGHEAGDQALRETAALLRATFRNSDVVARLGGDEFAVLALETDHQGTEEARRRLEDLLAAQNAESERRYVLSLSIGIAFCDLQQLISLDQLLAQADQAMYREKQGRARS